MVGKAVVPALTQDQMIKHGDPEQVASLFEASSQGTIFLTGSRIAAGMIVCQENGAGVHEDQWLEDFAWMDDAHSDRSDAHGVDADDRVFGVETHDHEMLAIESIEERLKKPVRFL